MTDGLSLELSHHFDATSEQVFDAWLSKSWGAWLPPAGARCEITELNATVGGQYSVAMTMADGRQVTISGTYREIDRPHKLVLTWMGNYNNQVTVLTLTFRAVKGGTEMSLKQEGFGDIALRDGYKSGWTGTGGSFEKLDKFLKTAR